MILPLVLYGALFAIAAFAPLRWSLVAYLLLSTIDFGAGGGGNIGILNAAKGILLPVYLLWRLRAYAGHQKIILAPIAWIFLVIYAGIAGFWSFFPVAALKLAGHMIGSLLICFVFLRATKAGYVTPVVVIPVTAGALVIAILRSLFMPNYGDEAARFTAFSSAQSFAAFLVALYCIALCSKTLRAGIRITLCALLVAALAFDGSRIWAIGLAAATLLALLVSGVRPWVKICACGLAIALAASLIAEGDKVMMFVARQAESNRIAAAITAVYEGDIRSYGLGTYELRRGFDAKEIRAIENSSIDQLLFGHGTSNGVLIITGSIFKIGTDPNRLMHNEWLRVMYEWGVAGMLLWLMFFGSIVIFAYQGLRRDPWGYSKPLLVYMPAFLLGLAGENIIAGAGNAVSVGFLLVIGLAGISHRSFAFRPPPRETPPVAVRIRPPRAARIAAEAGGG